MPFAAVHEAVEAALIEQGLFSQLVRKSARVASIRYRKFPNCRTGTIVGAGTTDISSRSATPAPR